MRLNALCFTVLPDLRAAKCLAPQMIFIGLGIRSVLYLPPLPVTTRPLTTTVEPRIIVEVNLREGLPAWAVGLLIVLLVVIGFGASYIYHLRQQKLKLLRHHKWHLGPLLAPFSFNLLGRNRLDMNGFGIDVEEILAVG